MKIAEIVGRVIDMAYDYSIETRIRFLLDSHVAAGEKPRTIVMNTTTWKQLVWEAGSYRGGYFWTSQSEGTLLDPEAPSSFRGIPILVKDFVSDQEVFIGV